MIAQAQLIMIDSETGEYNYEEVIDVSGITKQEVLNRAKAWLNIYYKTNDSISDNGSDVQKTASNDFVFKLIQKDISMKIFFDIEIKTKDNKYKYEFYNFEVGKKVKVKTKIKLKRRM